MDTRGVVLVRNTMLNLVAQAISTLVGLVAIPPIVRGLGTESFGFLSLSWLVFGYFAIFDLGLGRATTKYVAEALARGEKNRLSSLLWTAVAAQGAFGLVGAVVLASVTPLLAEHVLSVSGPLLHEATVTFYLMALAIPVVAVSSSFMGVLEAAQRFDLVNAVRVPSSVSTFVLPLLGLAGGLRLPGIVGLILASRFVTLGALVVLNVRVFPEFRRISIATDQLGRLTRYGGWVTVTSVVGPILTYLERFLIASLLSMAALSHYTASYEAVTRLLIVPLSLMMSLFPIFSALAGTGAREQLGAVFIRSVKYSLLALAPLVLALILFAEDILRIWLGSDFATHGTVAMQILAIGLLVNSLAHAPYGLLQGVGRPDLPAKFHVLQLGLYVPVAWLLVGQWGIAGAALAWTLRATVDAALLFVATFRVCGLSPRLLVTDGVALTSIAVLVAGTVAYGVRRLSSSLPILGQSALFLILVGVCGWLLWRNVLDTREREAIRAMARRWAGSRRALSE